MTETRKASELNVGDVVKLEGEWRRVVELGHPWVRQSCECCSEPDWYTTKVSTVPVTNESTDDWEGHDESCYDNDEKLEVEV